MTTTSCWKINFAALLLVVAGCKKAPSGAAPAGSEKKILFYRNPMRADVTSKVPMKDDMGMDYVPVYEETAEAMSGPATAGRPAVAGQGIVNLNAESEQKIGVRVAPVEKRDLVTLIKAPGRVAYDPNLYSAILEYQESARAHAESRAQGSSNALQAEDEATVRASALRLRQLGLSASQIDELSKPGFDPSNLLVGTPGGRIWIYVDIYDFETGLVKAGQRADFTAPAFPGVTFSGTVRAVDSIVNSETRTLRARVEVPNPRGELKPEMYLSATIRASIGKKLAIPDSALIDTGTRQLVYVEKAPGRFEPREVRVGREADGYFEVVNGLSEGESVATSANFLIDSESKIQGAR